MKEEGLNRALLEQLLSEDENTKGVAICQQTTEAIEIAGQKLIPDETKGYIEFKFSHSFPVVNAYGQALHPNVIAMSYNSLLHQPLDFEHQVVAYDREKIHHDKILGSVVAVEFPRAPMGGWKMPMDPKDAPAIRAAASFAKLARGMDNVVGKHLSGRHQFSVSMEVQYMFRDCAFAVSLNGMKPMHETPDDMAKTGWEYIPWVKAADDLLGCFSPTKNRIISDWQSRKVVQLMGGYDKPVHYSGVGIVHYPAEKTAEILQMAASATEDVTKQVLDPLSALIDLVNPPGCQNPE